VSIFGASFVAADSAFESIDVPLMLAEVTPLFVSATMPLASLTSNITQKNKIGIYNPAVPVPAPAPAPGPVPVTASAPGADPSCDLGNIAQIRPHIRNIPKMTNRSIKGSAFLRLPEWQIAATLMEPRWLLSRKAAATADPLGLY